MSDFRPRSASELLDAAFEIYRGNFAVFLAINIFAAIPVAISTYFLMSAVLLQQPDQIASSSMMRLAGALITPFTQGATACAASAAYLGATADFESSVRSAFRRPARLFFAMFAKWVLLFFGLVLLIVPGLIVFKRYFAVPMTVLFEDNNVGKAITRSRELSRGNGLRIFGLIGGVYVFTMIVSAILTSMLNPVWQGATASAVGTLVITTVISPFSVIIATLLYYDIRIRKEGYDIELMTQALDTAPPSSPIPAQ